MSENKQNLRRRTLAQRAAQDAAEKRAADRKITERVLQSEIYRRASCMFTYVATPQEIDTHALIRRALADGKTVCVPLCGAQGRMSARRIDSLAELHPGTHGILEPDEAAQEIDPAMIDLIIVPALACDQDGFRLGYGGGYYDRFLAQATAAAVALCAEARLEERLPREPHDRRCGWIITERRVLRTDEE